MSAPSPTPSAAELTRRAERGAAVGLRAVARRPDAELRGSRLEVDHRPVALVVPHLLLPSGDDDPSPVRRRGVADAVGLRLRHSDRDLHLALSPQAPLERVVFDIAEQFRCEACCDPALTGVRDNIAEAFDEWSESARSSNIGETGVGLLVFTITHMLRARLLRRPASEAVDDLIEVPRGNLARLVGHALAEMPDRVTDQERFAEPAREVARLLAELVDDATEIDDDPPDVTARNRLVIPVDWDLLDEELAEAAGDPVTGDPTERSYRIYTDEFDIEVTGASLYRAEVLRNLRRELDRQVSAQAVSVTRLAQRLQRVFPSVTEDGWSGGQPDGPLDPARLARIVVDPLDPDVRRSPRLRPSSDSAVTFLIDTTGSMKLQRYESVAVLVDTLTRALELAGSTVEVLGFSTASWAGGQAANRWRADGSPPDPGRISDTMHIVYKSFDASWRQARHSMAAMLRTDHYREGVDGEALAWAAHRLQARTERRRALVMISDGLPMEAATATNNRDGFLHDHLAAVARAIESDRGGLELGSIGIDHQLDDVIGRSVALDLDLDGTLTIGTYDVLAALFGAARR
ncbi:MAG: cobalt chelatase [Actinomycetota bacterium]